MSYTTRQVQSLLTQAELELFQASRATAIKAFTVRQLEARIKRARTLRNKYRDLHQRQMVRTGSGPASARKPMGGENARTEVKADVMQEVLSRFEAQLEKAQSAPAKTAASKRSSSARTTGGADIAMRGNKGTTAHQLARTKRAAADEAADAVQARAAKPSRAAAGKTTANKTAGKTASKSAAKKTATPKAAAKSVTGLVKAVRKAVAKKSATSATPKKAGATKGGKSLVSGAASDKSKGAVPTSMPASAARKNPLKAEPVNKKIHASARSRTRANEAKRDSR